MDDPPLVLQFPLPKKSVSGGVIKRKEGRKAERQGET